MENLVSNSTKKTVGREMSFMARSARVASQIVSVVVGDGAASPADETLRQHPHLAFYR